MDARIAALALLLTACTASHAGSDAGQPPDDALPERVSAAPYCARLEALGCSVVCDPDTTCDRERADACLDAVEDYAEGECWVVPPVLSEPICQDICD